MLKKSQDSLKNCLQATDKAKAFLMAYNPDAKRQICTDEHNCYFGNYPTLAEINREYGLNTSQAWLMPQLYNLSEYCGVKDKLTPGQYKELAFVIATQYYYLKISELMLFFHRFKAGYYGVFYGNVDPLVITTSMLTFVKERNAEIAKEHERQRKASETTAEQRQEAYEAWCKEHDLNPEKQETITKYFNHIKNN